MYRTERALAHARERIDAFTLRLSAGATFISMLKRRPIEVLSTFNANASRMAISAITFAELLHGAEKSSRVSGR